MTRKRELNQFQGILENMVNYFWMEHIITKHSTLASSLGGNKVAFEIKLHESQKFQDKNRREFLENNKIRINAIKNQNQAIASAAITDFNKFENKVREYKNTSKNKVIIKTF